MTYGTILMIHISAFILNFALVFVSDLLGLLWVTGKKQALNKRLMHKLHYMVWFGLMASIVSGAFLFWDARDYLLYVPAFYTKIALVGALVVNSFVIHKHLSVITNTPYKMLARKEKVGLIVSGAVSAFCWIGVVVTAQFLGL